MLINWHADICGFLLNFEICLTFQAKYLYDSIVKTSLSLKMQYLSFGDNVIRLSFKLYRDW